MSDAERFLNWLNTPKGQKAIEDSNRRVEETAEILEQGRDIPWWILREPYTI